MMESLNVLTQSTGMQFTDILIFMITIGCIIFMAKDFKLGLTMAFIFNLLLGMWFYTWSLTNSSIEYGTAFIISFMFLVLMALSIFFVDKTTQGVA